MWCASPGDDLIRASMMHPFCPAVPERAAGFRKIGVHQKVV